MKHLASIVAALLVLSGTAGATTYNLTNGNFGSQTGTISFASGDVINVPAATNVSFTSTKTINTDVTLNIHGTLMMTPGTKILTLAAGSVANIYPGGTLAGNDADQRLVIGTNNVFFGSYDITATTSVLTATGTSSGFALSGGTPLPIRLISFNASMKSGSMVSLNWSAINDGPASVFTIQQSTDGRNWTDEAEVSTSGSDHETVNYTHQLAAPKGVKTLVYRLRFTDNDGHTAFSPSSSVNAGSSIQEASTVISTNGNTIKLQINGIVADGSTYIYLSTMDGKLAHEQAYTSAEDISIPTFVRGVYNLTVTDNKNYRITQKIVMQ